MKKIYLTISILFSVVFFSKAQQGYNQYFDGADTSVLNSIIINFDTSSSNIWQIGSPQKIIFNSAATFPNAIVTDTINNYPTNNTSRFSFKIVPWVTWGLNSVIQLKKNDNTNRYVTNIKDDIASA